MRFGVSDLVYNLEVGKDLLSHDQRSHGWSFVASGLSLESLNLTARRAHVVVGHPFVFSHFEMTLLYNT